MKSTLFLVAPPAIGALTWFVDFGALPLWIQIGWVASMPILLVIGIILWVREGGINGSGK